MEKKVNYLLTGTISKKTKDFLKTNWARPEPEEPGPEPGPEPIIATALPANTCPRSPTGLLAQSIAFFNGPNKK
jgi:hypothetical protein